MGIANELSSDVAAALLARKDQQSQAETNDLIEIVRDFHSAMSELKAINRGKRLLVICKYAGMIRQVSGSHRLEGNIISENCVVES